jgi:(2R)-3-sulfolactate dehydrogenase (NADP+)
VFGNLDEDAQGLDANHDSFRNIEIQDRINRLLCCRQFPSCPKARRKNMPARLSLNEIEELSFRTLTRAGADERQAGPVACSIRRAEADGVRSHGLLYLPIYAAHLRSGKVDGRARPTVARPRAGAVTVDAAHGFAHPAIAAGLPVLAQAAREGGVAAMTVHRSYNCGVLGHHAEDLAREGLLALCFTHAPASIAPVGGRTPVVGTNPVALAVPDGAGGVGFVLDQSASVVAKSEVMLRARRGEPLEEGWALDAAGQPTTDPQADLAGSMRPAGGAKGFGLGLVAEVLASCLAGAVSSREASPFSGADPVPPATGQCLIAFDPGAFASGFSARISALVTAISDQAGARLPGSRRQQARQRTLSEGVAVEQELLERIRQEVQ